MRALQKYKKEEVRNIKKIGVIMLGLLGDVIIRTPVIRALKELYPNACITVIVDPIGKSVLSNNSDVDEIIVVNRKKYKNKLIQNFNKIKAVLAVRKQKFDLLVNLYNAGTSRLMVRFSNTKYTLGFCLQENEKLYTVENRCKENRLKEEQSLYNYMISIVEALSDKEHSLHPVFELNGDDDEKIGHYLESFSYNTQQLYTLNLASSKEDKILEYSKYFALVKYIYEKYGYIPAVVCNPFQEYIQENFVNKYLKKSNIPYIVLQKLSLSEVASLISQTRFIVTPDTGLMHLAMALDAYIYAIFTYTHPVFVDPKETKFIAVYEYFDKGKLYQHQNITEQTLHDKVDLLVSRLA